MRGFRDLARFFLGLLITLVAGCVSLPETQLRSFVEASGQIAEPGREIYLAFNRSIIDEERARKRGTRSCTDQAGRPICFDPTLHIDLDEDVVPVVEARILTLESVELYGQALAALNGGERARGLSATIDRWAATGSRLATVLEAGGDVARMFEPTVVAALRELAAELQANQDREAAQQLVLRQSPTIEAAIDALISDTSVVYDAYIGQQRGIATLAPGGLRSAAAGEQLAMILAMHESLGHYVTLLSAVKAHHRTLAEALTEGANEPERLREQIEQAVIIAQRIEALERSTAALRE